MSSSRIAVATLDVFINVVLSKPSLFAGRYKELISASQTICRPIRINNDPLPFSTYAYLRLLSNISVLKTYELLSEHPHAGDPDVKLEQCAPKMVPLWDVFKAIKRIPRGSYFELLDLTIANPDVVGNTSIRTFLRHHVRGYGTQVALIEVLQKKWSKMRTTIYPASPIDEDARSAINVEFSTQLRNTMHLLESESDLIQPVEISYKLLTGGISSVKMSTVDILLGSHQVLHAKYILNSGRVEECTMAYIGLKFTDAPFALLLETRTILHGLTVQNVIDFISPDAMFDEDIWGDVVTDHMLNTSVRDHVFRIRSLYDSDMDGYYAVNDRALLDL
jgi:hypothetical protein